jgi:hypothetical protein
VPPNGPILQRATAALERMGSGYIPTLSDSGDYVVFSHPGDMDPFALSTSPDLTFGEMLQTVADPLGADMALFLEHYPIDEFG